MTSGYYTTVGDDAVVNPGNILQQEDTGLLFELNAQSKITCRDRCIVSVDASYQYSPGPGRQKETDTHFNTNEFFIDLLLADWFCVKAGKKRESWAVGNVFFPLDIVNPPRNPVDPSKSREGIYMAMAEMPFGTSALNVVYMPQTEYRPDDRDGIPAKMRFEGGGLAIRSYFLIRSTDVALVYYRAAEIPSLMKDYYGVTVNRFFGYLGAYVELLGHEGSDREYVKKDEAGDYYFPGREERVAIGAADDRLCVNLSVGTNYTFGDDTKIGVEYLRNSDGYTEEEFGVFRDFIIHDSGLYRQTDDERLRGMLRQKLLKASEILQNRIRRNYLALSIDRPNTFDDFFPRLNAVVSLDDGSFVVNGLIEYFIREDTTLKLVISRPAGGDDTEYGLRPAAGRITLEVKYYW